MVSLEVEPDWFYEYLIFAIYGSTRRFIGLVGINIILSILFSWGLAFVTLSHGFLPTNLVVIFAAHSLVKEFGFVAVMFCNKNWYDSVQHPNHANFSVRRFLSWCWSGKEIERRSVVVTSECAICNTWDDSDKILCVNEAHQVHPSCIQPSGVCARCESTA